MTRQVQGPQKGTQNEKKGENFQNNLMSRQLSNKINGGSIQLKLANHIMGAGQESIHANFVMV